MKKKWRHILVGLGSIFGFSLVSFLCLLFYLNTDHAQSLGKRYINRNLLGTINWRQLDLSFFRGKVECRDFLLIAPNGEDLISLDMLSLNWTWKDLLGGQLAIEGRIEKPRVHLRRNQAGRLNLDDALSTANSPTAKDRRTSPFPLNLIIKSLTLTDGTLMFEAASVSTIANIHGIDLVMQGNLAQKSADVELNLAGGKLTWRDFQTVLKPSSLSGRLANNQLAPIQLSLATTAGEATLSGSIDQPFESPICDLQLNVEAALYNIASANLSGRMKTTININGPLDNPNADLQLTYNDGTVFGQTIEHLDGRVKLADRLLIIERLNATAGTDELQLIGQADLKPVFTKGFFDPNPDFKSAMIDADFSVKTKNLAESLAPLGITALKGGVIANGKMTGTFHQPQFDLWFDGSDLTYEDIRMGDIRINATLDSHGALRIGELSINNRGSLIKGKGEIQILSNTGKLHANPPLRLELTLFDVEALDFVDQKLVKGNLSGEIKLAGSMSEPLGLLNLEGQGIGVGDYAIGDVTAALKFKNSNLIMETVELVNGQTRVNITGSARIIEPATFKLIEEPVIDVVVTGKNIRIENYFPELRGQLSLEARLNGPLRRPRGPIIVHGQGLTFPWQYLDQIDLAGQFEGDTLKLDQLAVSPAPDEWIQISGRISPHALSDVKITTEGISLAHIGLLKEKLPVTGKLVFSLEGDGPFDNPTATGTVSMKAFKVGGKPLDDIRGDVDLKNKEASFNFRHGAANLTGIYHLVRQSFSINSRIHAENLAPYFVLFDLTDFGGQIRGEFQAEGDLENPDHIAVSGSLTEARLIFKGREMIRTKNAQMTYDQGRFHILGWDLILLNKGNLHVDGFGRPGSDIELNAQGDLPLAVGRMFSPRLYDLDGDLLLSATVKGKWDQPEVQGNLTIKSGSMTIPGWDERLYGVNGTITLQPETITISNLRGKVDEGDVSLTGALALDHFRPGKVDLALSVGNLPVRIPNRLDLFIDSQLKLEGTPDNTHLKGKVAVLDGTYYKDVSLNPMDMLKSKKTREKTPKSSDIEYPYLKNLNLNVEMTSLNPFLVENNLATLDLVSNIRIIGKLNQPKFVGRTEVSEGTVRLWNRKFQVTRGHIDFIDPYSARPNIEIRAETDIRQWNIYVDMTGSIDNLELTLSSNPSEESSDILALILTGKTSQEMIAGEGGKFDPTGAAISALAGTRLGEEIIAAAGLDNLEVDKVTDTASDQENTRVTLGKNLSDRMTLKYSMETKEGEIVQKTIAEYQLLENVLLSGFQDSNGIYGGALRYRIEFR